MKILSSASSIEFSPSRTCSLLGEGQNLAVQVSSDLGFPTENFKSFYGKLGVVAPLRESETYTCELARKEKKGRAISVEETRENAGDA
ncbi:hypothetical protein K0M31_002979 [Melipona bicolor]|uniref:Uncharacterized protein n=1 Tax=Melipona bicolor TaxID=60889 RepID=A0AA40KQ06_9HYME|nr:hypothetical protein K0M31_002979 [Melipona bicolor]